MPSKPVKNEPKTDERLKPILAALKDKKAAVRQQVLEDLGKLGDDGRPATDAVCQIVASDPSPAVRQVLDCLDKIYPDLSNKVVVLVVEADPLKHVKAVQEIGGLGEDVRRPFRCFLTHLRTASARFPTDLDAIMSEDVRALGTVAPDDPAVQKGHRIMQILVCRPLRTRIWTIRALRRSDRPRGPGAEESRTG